MKKLDKLNKAQVSHKSTDSLVHRFKDNDYWVGYRHEQQVGVLHKGYAIVGNIYGLYDDIPKSISFATYGKYTNKELLAISEILNDTPRESEFIKHGEGIVLLYHDDEDMYFFDGGKWSEDSDGIAVYKYEVTASQIAKEYQLLGFEVYTCEVSNLQGVIAKHNEAMDTERLRPILFAIEVGLSGLTGENITIGVEQATGDGVYEISLYIEGDKEIVVYAGRVEVTKNGVFDYNKTLIKIMDNVSLSCILGEDS